MATTTTNYGWDIPQSTDLVKDGATAIATLGQDIDTSVYTALAGNKSGLVLLNTTSFTGVSSYSLPQDTFTTTYDYYKLNINISALTGTYVTMRLRASGSDNSTSNYKYSIWANGSNGIFTFNASTSTSDTEFDALIEAVPGNCTLDIAFPKSSVKTQIYAINTQNDRGRTYTGTFDLTTSFDSLSLLATSITGIVSVYGYNK